MVIKWTKWIVVALSVALLAGSAVAQEFADILTCPDVLRMHPGKHHHYAADHPRANETLLQTVKRTGDREWYHRQLSYFRLQDISSCLHALFFKIDRLQESVDRLSGQIQEIQAEQNRR